MNCKLCGEGSVVLHKDGPDRRRQCTGCGHRFITTELLKDEHQRRERLIGEAVALAEKLTAGA